MDVAGLYHIGFVHSDIEEEIKDSMTHSQEIHSDEEWLEIWDDVIRKVLRPDLVRAVRKKEIDDLCKTNVHTKVSIQECWDTTRK